MAARAPRGDGEPRLFGEVTRSETGGRALRRGGWLAVSLLAQAALLAILIALPRPPAERRDEPLPVPVKILRPSLTPSQPLPRPAPPPSPARPPVRPKPRATAQAQVAPLRQPKEVAAALAPPDPAPPAEPEEVGTLEDGTVGGVVGGSSAGTTMPAPAEPPRRVEFDDTMARPVLVSGPRIAYTQQALDRGVDGEMVVKCVITVEGTVHDCRVLRSLPYMDRSVVEALEARRYRPATLAGSPLEVNYTFKVKLSPNSSGGR